MEIRDFTPAHAAEAAAIAHNNYEEERRYVPALPPVGAVPDLSPFAENGLGVAAFRGGSMVGFLCCYPPHGNAFGSTDAVSVFSPMGANGAVGSERAKTFARMYQAAGEKWAAAGASSHAVCLYAHDVESQEQFFRYGFGIRCVDAIRGADDIVYDAGISALPYECSELAPDDILKILPLHDMHVDGYIDSPFFMYRKRTGEAEFMEYYDKNKPVYFAAKYRGVYVAYVCACRDGETFIKETPGYIHANGAYCLPEHRGNGLSAVLLGMLIKKLRSDGYTRVGVDFESINPFGYGFWTKYFAAYMHSVVRRIDEYAITKKTKK